MSPTSDEMTARCELANLRKLDRVELLELRSELVDQRAQIVAQLDELLEADPEWRRKADVALRYRKRWIERVERMLGEQRRETRGWFGRFVELVRAALGADETERLLSQAKTGGES